MPKFDKIKLSILKKETINELLDFGCKLEFYKHLNSSDKIEDFIADMSYNYLHVQFLEHSFCLTFRKEYTICRTCCFSKYKLNELFLYKNIDKFVKYDHRYYHIAYSDLKEILFENQK